MKKIHTFRHIIRALPAVCAAGAYLCGCAKDAAGRQEEKQASFERKGTWQSELSDGEDESGRRQNVSLTVWGGEEDTDLMKKILEEFQNEYKEQAEFHFTYEVQSESGCKDALLAGLENGADVFAFADDQLQALAAAGALEPLEEEEADAVRAENLARAVEAACVGDQVYAYPLTADNGYFLYFNKAYFTDKDVKSLQKILKKAAEAGKYFTMDWSSAWYVYSFFGNTGLEVGLNEDGITNYCTWNGTDGTVAGVDVAAAMEKIALSPGFASRTDEEFMEGVRDGTVIAGVSGVWNAVALKEAWGENLGAARLPVYKCGGKKIQMASFSGCKLIGVNAYSKHFLWAKKLAAWITNEKNQKLRFEMRGQGPSNIQAAQSQDVQNSAAIAALLAQSEFSHLQRVGGKFWDPVTKFSENLLLGRQSDEDLQKQLDQMVEKITER